MNEEYIMQLAAIEQEINRLEQQMQLIEQNIVEMRNLCESLKELEKSKEKQMLANLGKNIFIKTEILDKNLVVDIGNKIFLKKSIPETLEIVNEQLARLEEAKVRVIDRMQEVQKQAEQVILDAEKAKEGE